MFVGGHGRRHMRLRYLWLFFSVLLGRKECQGFSNLSLITQARLKCLGYLVLLIILSRSCFNLGGVVSLRGLSSSSFIHHVVLNRLVEPLFGSTDTRDDICSLFVE